MGRASGGLATIFNRKFVESIKILEMTNSTLITKCKISNNEYIVCNNYIRDQYAAERLEDLRNSISELNESYDCPIILGGDFNSRVGLLNESEPATVENSFLAPKRTSMDLGINKNGRKLCQIMEENIFFDIKRHKCQR